VFLLILTNFSSSSWQHPHGQEQHIGSLPFLHDLQKRKHTIQSGGWTKIIHLHDLHQITKNQFHFKFLNSNLQKNKPQEHGQQYQHRDLPLHLLYQQLHAHFQHYLLASHAPFHTCC